MTSPTLPDRHAARAAILGALRRAPQTAVLPSPSITPYLAGPYGRGSQGEVIDPATLIAPFEAAARGWRADVQHATSASWPDVVQQALRQRGCQRIAIGAASELDAGFAVALAGLAPRRYTEAIETWKTELFDGIDAGLTSSDAGLADTGTLLLRPGAHEPRTLSLVPPVHVAVLRASRLHASLPAAMLALQPQADLPTNLVLITGPSKTSDIQQTLAYGAHGPKELVIVLVNDLESPRPELPQ
ncbi:MAG: lactate utilization protein C [Leptothrix sp. (in: b-proteobacteria)]